LRTGGGGDGGGAATGAGLVATLTAGLTGFAARTGRADLAAGREDGVGRRPDWAGFLAVRAGLRVEVRDFATRRDFAMWRYPG
jgi:hypothetical protein